MRRPKPYRIVLEGLPLDARVALEAAMDDAEVLLIQDGAEVGRVVVQPSVLEGIVLPDLYRDADAGSTHDPEPVPDGVTVVATAMRLSRKARARLSEELGDDYIVMDLGDAPDSADVLLIPRSHPPSWAC